METVRTALLPLGVDVRRWPGKTGEDTYIALTLLDLKASMMASNRATRRAAEIQVDLYTLGSPDALTDQIMTALTGAGCVIVRVGAEQYETDTKYHHMPIVCQARHPVA